MPSIQAKVMNKIASVALKSYRGNGAGFVRRFRMVTAASNFLAPVPKGLKHIKGALGGVPGEWLIPVNPKGALLYIHGGGFVAGHPPMYRPFCGALANALGFRVFMVDYRLAPENPFPAPLDDCIAAFEALVADIPAGEPVFVAGDSAGGNLSLAVLQHALKKKLPAHGGLLISPATDMRRLSPSIEGNDKTDSMLSAHMIEHAANLYMCGHDPADERASPLLGKLKGLPPLMVTASEDECLLDDSLLLRDAVEKVGGQITMLTRPGMPHIWPTMNIALPEAKEDLVKIIRFFSPLVKGI
jgi:epsilon-lactone hydrolase